ncbi:MAG: transglycosylase domain-containing protein [Ramlibacter sp.]|nr:transglycosylase domain-containing protein [Ramlibacter sp.]
MAVAYVLALVPFTPAIEDIRKFKAEQPTVVLSADGKELAVFKRANREWVRLDAISPNVLAALIATEDQRFYDHHGFDFRRTVAAALHTARGKLQGGSTITQQLARNLYPEEIGRAPTITRKVKEAITALKIETVHSKDEILEIYLNTVPFLYNAYGIEMAARTYFDKTAGELDVLESATLIGMLKGTSYYNPVLNPERSLQRRNTVLAQMARQGKLEAAGLEQLKKQPLALDFERQAEDFGSAPHVTQQLRRWLIEWADRNGYNIYADGLVLRTTLDAGLQARAEEAVKRQADKLQQSADGTYRRGPGWKAHKQLAETFVRETAEFQAARQGGLADDAALKKLQADTAFMQKLWEDKTRLQAGFLALDPANGHVKAWIGSRGFDEDKFDHVAQARRQPGSTFKPFVYGAAFEQGISPAESFVDQLVEIRIDERTVWTPGDVGEPSGLPMTLRDGLALSKNSITSQLMQRIGPARVAKVAWDMGVRQSKLDQVPSLALGTSPVTLKEMVSAFGTIANGGSYVEPVLVTRVEDRNHRVLEDFRPRTPERALSLQAAETLLDVMRGVVDRGTGAGIRSRFGIQGDVAGKTGTTQSNTDGWFILMHPQLVGGAWVGFNDNRVTMRGDAWGQGAHNALNIVGDFFQQSLKAKAIDAKARFAAPRKQEEPADALGRVNDWFGAMFGRTYPEGAAPVAEPLAGAEPPPTAMAPAVTLQAPATMPPPAPEQAVAAQPELPPSFQRVPEIQRPDAPRAYEAPRGPVTLRVDRQGQVVVTPREPMPSSLPTERPVLAPQAGESGAAPAVSAPPTGGETIPQ